MRFILTVVMGSVLMLSGTTAFAAADLGPAAPYGDAGQLSLGLGYAYYSSEWKSDNTEIPVDTFKRSNAYLQLSYAFTSAWEAYVRAGFANAEMMTGTMGDPFNNPITFKDGFKPSVGVGFKGLAHNGEKWDAGPFVQYNIYGEYSELWEGSYENIYLAAELTYESMWDLAVGGAFSYESDFAVLTLAPYLFWSKADSKLAKTIDEEIETLTAKLEEKNVVGGMFGVMVPMSSGFLFNVEAQYQSGFYFSVSGTKIFGRD